MADALRALVAEAERAVARERTLIRHGTGIIIGQDRREVEEGGRGVGGYYKVCRFVFVNHGIMWGSKSSIAFIWGMSSIAVTKTYYGIDERVDAVRSGSTGPIYDTKI